MEEKSPTEPQSDSLPTQQKVDGASNPQPVGEDARKEMEAKDAKIATCSLELQNEKKDLEISHLTQKVSELEKVPQDRSIHDIKKIMMESNRASDVFLMPGVTGIKGELTVVSEIRTTVPWTLNSRLVEDA